MTASRTDDLRYWLALHRAPKIGDRKGKLLLDYFGEPRALFAEPPAALAGLGLGTETVAWLSNPRWADVEKDLRWLASSPDHHCLTIADEAYPSRLREIPDPPLLLFVAGDCEALARRQIAVVGSRNPSPGGERAAHDFSSALVDAGFGITSGLAIGIDAAAHKGALDRGGMTVAVAGTGPDVIYPARHAELAAAIRNSGGALVSEFPAGVPPQAANFPRRNRIISGLSEGTLVVEAALRSGSLITARMALDQGREVFAVPGSVQNPTARGCNQLIKQGAKLVECVDDILEEFGWRAAGRPSPGDSGGAENASGGDAWLLKYIAYDPTSVDTLVAATGSTPDAISAALLRLELQGHIFSTSGGCYCRAE